MILKIVDGVKMLPIGDGTVYLARGCQVPDWDLFPRPSMTRPSLPVLEKLGGKDNFLYGADPDCDHYVTYRGWDGVMCVRCSGWYCA